MPTPGKRAHRQEAEGRGESTYIYILRIDCADQKQGSQSQEQRHGNQREYGAEDCGDIQVEPPQSHAPLQRLGGHQSVPVEIVQPPDQRADQNAGQRTRKAPLPPTDAHLR